MYQHPIDEYILLQSLPGFHELTEEEKLRFRIAAFEYGNQPILSTVTLLFSYGDYMLKFEMSFSREKGCYYQHVMSEEDYDEKEFPSFRRALDYCNSTKNT